MSLVDGIETITQGAGITLHFRRLDNGDVEIVRKDADVVQSTDVISMDNWLTVISSCAVNRETQAAKDAARRMHVTGV